MTRKFTCRGLLRTLGTGAAVSLTSGVTVTDGPAGDGDGQQSEPYDIAWNEVTTFESDQTATTDKDGGQSHALTSTRGGYVTPGTVHYSQSSGDDRGLLAKYDTNGIKVLEKVLGESGYRLRGGSNSGGNYVAVGDAQSDGWIVCVDPYGQTLWEHRVGHDSRRATLNGVTATDEHIVAAGRYEKSKRDVWGWVVQYNHRGEQIRQQQFQPGRNSGPGRFNDVTAIDDGEYLVVGRGREGGRAGISWSVRLTAGGTEQWNRLHPVAGEIGGGRHGGHREEANSVVALEDGSVLIAGLTRAAVADGWAALVVKLDSDGSIAWSRIFDFYRLLSANDAVVAESDTYLITGNTGGVNPHFWTASLNPDGSLNWREEYLATHTERATGIVTAPGGAMVGGHSPSRGQQGWPNPWLARLDDDTAWSGDGFDPRVHGFGFGNWGGKSSNSRLLMAISQVTNFTNAVT
jgi:hypothetical protein